MIITFDIDITVFKNFLRKLIIVGLTSLEGYLEYLAVSSLFIAGVGFFVTYIASILLGINPSVPICIAVSLIVFSIYSLDKLTDSKEDAINAPKRMIFLEGRKELILFYSIAAYVLSLILIFLEIPSALGIALVPIAANAAYGSKLLPGMPRLKDIPVMKNLVVAITWASIATLLPGAHNAPAISIAIVFYFVFVKCFINTVLYDIRDIKGDRENGVKTMPVILGPKRTAAILLLINSTLIPWLMMTKIPAKALPILLIFYGYIYIIYFRDHMSSVILDILVDGEWIIAFVLLLALKDLGLA